MTCREAEPCGQTPCEALTEIQWLLPPGAIWELREGRNLTRFWSAIAEAKSCLMDGICQEWNEADPCTATRTLERWARIWCFPTDCVDLTADKLCQWIDLILTCEPGTEGFILALLEFVEFDMTDIEVKFSDCCENLFGARCGACITFCGPFERFTIEECDCTWSVFKTIQNPCGYVHLPEIECLRSRFFPVNIAVKYEPDCDPNLIRQLRAA